ncbi:MAG: LamG-like jellyroll fold domain-containing protein, partial [Terriglobia bacterium]
MGHNPQIGSMFSESGGKLVTAKVLGVLSVCVLCGILVAGLWPFHSPKNEVTWLGNDNGLLFGDYGTILSSSAFKMGASQDPASCSLEIWLQPGLTYDTNTFLAFYTPGNPLQFSLHQSNPDLELQRDSRSQQHQTRIARLYIDHVFRQGKPVFITITSDAQETRVYIGGALVRKSRQFKFSAQNLTGELVVGNSPVENDSWSGELRGLAIDYQELKPPEVFEHYHTWTTEGRPQIAENERNIALYLFNEQRGNIIRNHVSSGPDLYIPERYTVLNQIFLHPIWKEFSLSWGYWKNVLINIGGFIPLGFVFCAFFSAVSRIKRPSLLTILLGFTVSLT